MATRSQKFIAEQTTPNYKQRYLVGLVKIILEVYVRHPNDSGIQPIGPVIVTNQKFRMVNQP
mgnify:CR=1 FL=1